MTHLQLQVVNHHLLNIQPDWDGSSDRHVVIAPRLIPSLLVNLIRVLDDRRLLVHKFIPTYPEERSVALCQLSA